MSISAGLSTSLKAQPVLAKSWKAFGLSEDVIGSKLPQFTARYGRTALERNVSFTAFRGRNFFVRNVGTIATQSKGALNFGPQKHALKNYEGLLGSMAHKELVHQQGIRFSCSSVSQEPQKKEPYSWIDKEARELIAKAYSRHKSLADKSQSFPPSLSVKELERIGVPYSKPPEDFVDRLSLGLMKFLRTFVHAFFREKYNHHAVCLETVAAVPGMVGTFHRHMRSLRRMQRDHGWIGVLNEEAENERMHLLIFMKVTKPTMLERSLVYVAQGTYIFFYSTLYFVLPRAAHRLTGYLEEEAHRAYTEYLRCIDEGKLPNDPAPDIAREYYRLAPSATMRDVILHIRADEACHRDVNHHLGDKYKEGDLNSSPTSFGSF